MKLKNTCSWKKSYDQPRQYIKNQRHCWQKSINSKLCFFQQSSMDVRVGLQRKLSTIELMLLNCGVGWRRLSRILWTARKANQSILKETSPNIHWKDWCWSWSSNTLATWCEELTHLRRPWFWERLKAGREGANGGWDGWMASPTQWTWVWASSWSWWWTGKPGVLQSTGSWTVGHNWTEACDMHKLTEVSSLPCEVDNFQTDLKNHLKPLLLEFTFCL